MRESIDKNIENHHSKIAILESDRYDVFVSFLDLPGQLHLGPRACDHSVAIVAVKIESLFVLS